MVEETKVLGWTETGKRGQPRTLRRTLRPSDFFPKERMERWVLIQFRHDRPPLAVVALRLRLRLRVRPSCSSIGSSDSGARRFILCNCICNLLRFDFREKKKEEIERSRESGSGRLLKKSRERKEEASDALCTTALKATSRCFLPFFFPHSRPLARSFPSPFFFPRYYRLFSLFIFFKFIYLFYI